MEVFTRTQLQELLPEAERKFREALIEKQARDIYKTVLRLASVGAFEYKHVFFGDEKTLVPYVFDRLREVFLDIDVEIQSTWYKNWRTQRLVENEKSAIYINWR